MDKVRPVVGLHLSPPSNAVVLSAREHFRHGTTSLFAALNVATGEVIGRTHRKPDMTLAELGDEALGA